MKDSAKLNSDPLRHVTFKEGKTRTMNPRIRRVGTPRQTWAMEAVKSIWKQHRHDIAHTHITTTGSGENKSVGTKTGILCSSMDSGQGIMKGKT